MNTISAPPHSFVIYGAGNKGREICTYLRKSGRLVSAFIDAHAQPNKTCLGLPTFTPDAWKIQHNPTSVIVVVAIHNFAVNMPPLLSAIHAMGFAKVLNVVEFYNHFPNAIPDHYWLTDSSYYTPFTNAIASLKNLLADEKSRHLLDAVVEFRCTGDYSKLPLPSLDDQYKPTDLPQWNNPLRFIDCGAFDGDTLDHLQKAGYRFEAISAFEPDQENYRALVTRIRAQFPSTPATCFPCGVSATSDMLRFDANEGMSSALNSQGSTCIQCVAIDEALIGFLPNLIKMDIEGAEPDALLGAKKTIETSRPGLAISLYHHPAHLWQIPLLVASWQLDYTFFIRAHGHNTFDLVMYAFPN